MKLLNLLKKHNHKIAYFRKGINYYYKKSTLIIILIISLFYFCICSISIIMLANYITGKYIHMIGENLATISYVISKSLQLHDSDVEELKALSYDKLPEHRLNKQLESLFMDEDIRIRGLSYAYVMVKLSPNEVKYYVTEENKDEYSRPAGTPLDIVYLLDIALDKTAFETESLFDNDYYTDQNRYDVVTEEERKAMENRIIRYYIHDDIWGKYVSGTVPFYSVEGNYIGTVGIDALFKNFIKYRNALIVILSIVFIIPVLFVVLMYYLFYKGYIEFLLKISTTDHLTGLYNREFYHDNYERMIANNYRNNQNLAIIMIDIDYFKKYNDTYGHQAGDECLKQIAATIKLQLNRPLDMLIRYGGEEFLVLAPDTDYNGAITVARNIECAIKALHIPHKASTVCDYVTVSQGIFIVNANNVIKNVYKYVEKADEALYQSKSYGRNRFTAYEAY